MLSNATRKEGLSGSYTSMKSSFLQTIVKILTAVETLLDVIFYLKVTSFPLFRNVAEMKSIFAFHVSNLRQSHFDSIGIF